MPSASPPLDEALARDLLTLGERLRAARRPQLVSAAAAAEAAGMSRVTWHRIERGEPSVTAGAWLATGRAVGLQLGWVDESVPATTGAPLPDRIVLAQFPALRQLAWQQPDTRELSPQDALALYERNWRHVDKQALTMREIALIQALSNVLGGGRLLV